MIKKSNPYNYDYHSIFPDMIEYLGWEGGMAYKAIKNGKPYLIIDDGSMAEVFDENDPSDKKILDSMTTIIQFKDKEELEKYVTDNMSFAVDMTKERY